MEPLDINVDQFENGTKNEESTYTVRFGISKYPIYSIFDEIKQSLILDPDLDQLENWANNQKSKYIFRFSISKNPKNSIFVKSKLNLVLDPLDLNVNQFENGTKN